MLKKYATGEVAIQSINAEMALNSEANMKRFRELTAEIKRVAPKSDEFVYFVCRAIHAMEHANLDPVTQQFSGDGHIVRRGEDGCCSTCKQNMQDWQEGLWHSEAGVKPYINQNGDAFPESELLKEVTSEDGKEIKAFETFIGRGLFVNHASDDAEKIRGIILDAQWDQGTKGVDILVACDKVAYPELARQIEMGYSNDVSMGTQVAYSLCSDCGNRAVTEDDYCEHVRASKGLTTAGCEDVYEINNGLNFIEISVVSNGADPRAKIKTVLAKLNETVNERETRANTCVNPMEAERLRDEIRDLQAQIQKLSKEASEGVCNDDCDDIENGGVCTDDSRNDAEQIEARRIRRYKTARDLGLELEADPLKEDGVINDKKESSMSKDQEKKAYFQGGGGLNDPSATPYQSEDYTSVRDNDDKQMIGQGMEPGSEGMAGDDESVKQQVQRGSIEERRQRRHALLNQTKEAYFQGGGDVNDPATLPYEKEDYVKVRDTEDKQMVGQGMEPGSDGMAGDDASIKEQLQRAKLRATFRKSASRGNSAWTLFAGSEPLMSVTAEQLYGEDLDVPNEDNSEITNWEWVNSKDYGKNLIQAVKQLGFDTVKAQIERAAQAEEGMPLMDLEGGEDLGLEEMAPEEGEGEELGVGEQISAAIDTIEEASRELRALNEGDEADVESLGTEMNLNDAGVELEGLGENLEAAKDDEGRLKALNVVVKEALEDADKAVKKAKALVTAKSASIPSSPKIEKVAAEDEVDEEDVEEAKEDIDDAEEKLDDAEEELSDSEDDDDDDTCEAMSASKILERKAARYKLASELYQITDGDMIAEAHPGGGTDVPDVDGDAHVETETEQQAADMEVAEKQPRGELTARQSARRKLIAKLEAEAECGNCTGPEDCTKGDDEEDEEEATDKTAQVQEHLTEVFSEAEEAEEKPEIDEELKQEFVQKSTANTHELKLRMKRAYRIANKQAQLGQIESTDESIEAQVDRLTDMDSDSFDALANVVDNTEIVKDAKVTKAFVKSAGAIQLGRTKPGLGNGSEDLSKGLGNLPWK